MCTSQMRQLAGLTKDSARLIIQLRPTSPKEGLSAETPLVSAGNVIEPPVSVPTENGTKPAAVADPGPAGQSSTNDEASGCFRDRPQETEAVQRVLPC